MSERRRKLLKDIWEAKAIVNRVTLVELKKASDLKKETNSMTVMYNMFSNIFFHTFTVTE
jgi:hypothetical protein